MHDLVVVGFVNGALEYVEMNLRLSDSVVARRTSHLLADTTNLDANQRMNGGCNNRTQPDYCSGTRHN
jgi:hypothetical protein